MGIFSKKKPQEKPEKVDFLDPEFIKKRDDDNSDNNQRVPIAFQPIAHS